MPDRLDAFMARANAAYYATHDPFADFTTAPEISQCFGELIGAWAAIVWEQMGKPPALALVEAGPGRGTLMQDARRATSGIAPQFHAAAKVHFIETSPRLRREQALRVPDAAWHGALDDVPLGPAIVLANEFLDALPIRQFEYAGSAWCERFVEDGGFELLPAERPVRAARHSEEGSVVEVTEAGCVWAARLAARLARHGGAALILDYGPGEFSTGDSLQALRDGRPADPLCDAGSADITAHVPFMELAETVRAAGARAWGPLPQGIFLTRLGLWQRAGKLARANPLNAEAINEAAHRLAAPSRMGYLFKAFAITPVSAAAPPGFEPA